MYVLFVFFLEAICINSLIQINVFGFSIQKILGQPPPQLQSLGVKAIKLQSQFANFFPNTERASKVSTGLYSVWVSTRNLC